MGTALCDVDTRYIVQQLLDTSRRGLGDLTCRDDGDESRSFIQRSSRLRSRDRDPRKLLVGLTEVVLRLRRSYILRTDGGGVGTSQRQASERADVDDTVHRVEGTVALARHTPEA